MAIQVKREKKNIGKSYCQFFSLIMNMHSTSIYNITCNANNPNKLASCFLVLSILLFISCTNLSSNILQFKYFLSSHLYNIDLVKQLIYTTVYQKVSYCVCPMVGENIVLRILWSFYKSTYFSRVISQPIRTSNVFPSKINWYKRYRLIGKHPLTQR